MARMKDDSDSRLFALIRGPDFLCFDQERSPVSLFARSTPSPGSFCTKRRPDRSISVPGDTAKKKLTSTFAAWDM
jgi:hypothetical protein